MLPASARVRSRTEHRLVATRGRRARRGPLVVHLLPPDPVATDSDDRRSTSSPVPSSAARAGVVVGRRVGGAVERNRVKRRVREHLRTRLPAVPRGTRLVVRALPGAASAGFDDLGEALDAALRALAPRPGAAR